ncbi:MAG: hypothetical protein VYA30_13545 [Myxococcota bacterium]|nr:hypothetical protein [Myxococcota bacterium]
MKLFWGFSALFIWRLLTMLPASAVNRMYRTEAYLGGIIMATAILITVHTRFFGATKKSMPTPIYWLPLAFCAGCGFGIIGKELRNIGLSIASETIPLAMATPPNVSPTLAAMLASLVYPTCFVMVFCCVIAHAIYSPPKLWQALAITVIIGSIGVPLPLIPKVIFVLGLPVWLYLRTQSVSLAILSYLPANSLPLINALGINPGISGFDLEDPMKVILQPIWFNAFGAVLIALGLFPILNSLTLEDDETP